ncbi:hypothetical protein NUW58_g5074 [Xylaria curta]|uniref:Uncharacterized protein n=1 Tax=Xylaria curta TaxID=42375 RepID=A0ACC1P4N5_9PEZI|nr:hypothetical protein NUW58_g5074 [Xylaria curta]
MGNEGIWIAESLSISGKYKRVRSQLQLNLEKEVPGQALDMSLDHGADVDSKLVGYRTLKGTTAIDKLHIENRVPLKCRLSFLDQAYYWNTKLYERLSPYSRGEGTHITRPGICISAKRGKEFLRGYLGSRSPQHPADRTRLLELTLAEQFFIEDCSIDAQVVQGLVDFGVDIKLPTMATTSKTLCSRLVATAGRLGFFTDAALPLLQLLVSQGAAIDQTVMFTAVTKTGLGILPQLLSYGADIKTHGGYALCCAAVLNNFEAVSWLLEAGADINATISTPWGTGTIIFLASVYSDLEIFNEPWVGAAKLEIEMLAYLIRHGAKLQLGPSDSGSYQFLKAVLERHYWGTSGDLNSLELLLDSVACPEDLATDQESLLSSWNPWGVGESDSHLAAYELLLRRGCPIRRNCQLALYICYGGPHEIVYKLLDAGADVNAPSRHPLYEYSISIAQKEQTSTNPAAGRAGRTALQGACELEPQPIGDRTRKLDLVKFLIDQGADVNAPPAKISGNTALQLAAWHGDIAIALVLLEHGAKINAPPAKKYGLCALDAAAVRGRLDMVKLLLSMAAHSHDRGATGYAGAIRLAAANGHFAVAELIREHIKTFGNCIIVDVGDGNLVDMPNDLSQSSADDDDSDDSDYGHVSDESEGYDSEDI